MQGTKKEDTPHATMQAILAVVLDQSHYPLLIHCNQGKHRTGCVIAAARKISGWRLDSVLDEYRLYAEPKVRECDVEYISALEVASLQVHRPWRGSTRFGPSQAYTFARLAVLTFFVMVLWSGCLMTMSLDHETD